MKTGETAKPTDFHIGLVGLAAFFVVWSLRATVFYFIDVSIPSDFWRSVYSTAIKAALWLAPAYIYVRWIRGAPALKYLGISVVPSGREWNVAALVTALYLGSVVGLEVAIGGKSLHLSLPTSFAFDFLAASALIEEILFRGLVLHEFSRRFSGVPANIIASLLFVGVHWPYWLWSRGPGIGVLADSVGVFLASLLFGWLYLRTRSIWPCFVAHVANNIVAGFWVASDS
jgi:membrane protease YdiL (CAAX protease family)